MPGKSRRGAVIAIGGHEDREEDKIILQEVARRVGKRPLVVVTVASSSKKEELRADYTKAFHGVGLKDVRFFHVDAREEALAPAALKVFEGAHGVFFTGGDQVKLTSQIGDTPVFTRIHEIFEQGGVIAGTSAGASAMSTTMMVRGEGSRSARVDDALVMAPGLGFLQNVVIDQHFAERGRIGRLLGVVAQNPASLGVGIDEDTAIIEENGLLTIIGSGAVYIVDGRMVTRSNLRDQRTDVALSVFNVITHVLSMGDHYDLGKREPTAGPPEAVMPDSANPDSAEGETARS